MLEFILAKALLKKEIASVTSGVKDIYADPTDSSKIIFELNDGSKTYIQIPEALTQDKKEILDALSIDANGELLYKGAKLKQFTDLEVALLQKFTEDSSGNICYDGTPLASLTEQEKEQIEDITNHFTVVENADGTVSEVNLGGILLTPVLDAVTGDVTGLEVNGKRVITEEEEAKDSDIVIPW